MTERVGLIGWPVEHSVSPAMHNAAFEALGLDWRYDLLPVKPGELASELPLLIEQGYRGFNVTVPHKMEALALTQSKDSAAQAVGAANTLVKLEAGSLWAVNTDMSGFWRDLVEHEVARPPADALILGTGGSARAVAFALLIWGWRVHVLSRDDARARSFAGSLRDSQTESLQKVAGDFRVDVLPRTELGARAGQVKLVVNCTPVGMWPQSDASPWPDDVPIPTDSTVYDLVYNPPRTALMAQAEAAGARAIGGLGMLVQQGGLAFELWTQREPPLGVMRAAAKRAVSEVR